MNNLIKLLLYLFLFTILVFFSLIYVALEYDKKNNPLHIQIFQISIAFILLLTSTIFFNFLSNILLKNNIKYFNYLIDCINKDYKIIIKEIFTPYGLPRQSRHIQKTLILSAF